MSSRSSDGPKTTEVEILRARIAQLEREAEEAVQATRERLNWVLEKVEVGTWLNELPLGELNWDDRTRTLFCVPPGTQPTIELFWSRLHPEDREPTRVAVEEAIRGHSLYKTEHRIVHPDTGEIRWIRSIGRAFYAPNGTPVGFDGINYDITERKRAEQTLRENENVLRSFFESPGVMRGVVEVIADDDLRHITDNVVMARFLGFTPEAMRGRLASELGEPRDVLRLWISHYRCSQNTGQPVSFEYLDCRGDARVWFSVTVAYLDTTAAGNPRFSYIAFDVTERKRAEAALRESEERLQEALHASRSFAFDWEPATDRVRRSASCAPLLGLTGEDATSDSASRFFQRVHPDDREGFMATVSALTPANARYETTYRVVRPDGAVTVIRESARAFFDGEGRLLRLVGTSTDVTAREQAHEALIRSESLLRTIIETSEDAIYVKDRDSRVLVANPATFRVIGKPAEQVIGHADTEFYDDHGAAARIVDNDRRVISTGGPTVVEETVSRSGDQRTYLSSKVPFRDPKGRIIGLIGISRDITERKRLEDSLRVADRRKDEFLAMLAHELRNPLAAISAGLELLRRPETAAEARVRAQDAAARQTAHMARLLDDLLDISRVTQGKVTLNKADVSLLSIVDSAIEASRPLINTRAHRLHISLPQQSMHVYGDPVRLSQAVGNLLDNSARYTPPGGEIKLTLDRHGDEALIIVQDNGAGIEPHLLPHVFELFVQGSRSPDRAEGGLGVGLTLVRALVELHGGQVEARSGGPGTGSEFRIFLPVLPHREVRVPEQRAGEERVGPFHILIADDNLDTAELLSVYLQMQGHKVLVANSGMAAIDLALEHVPEIAMIDIGMPGMDGYEVARRLRNTPELSNTVLVAVTGYGQQEDFRKSREAGFHEHLVKPLDFDTLQDVLRKIHK